MTAYIDFIFGFIIGIIVLVVVHLVMKDLDLETKCTASGGITARNNICIKKESIIDIKD